MLFFRRTKQLVALTLCGVLNAFISMALHAEDTKLPNSMLPLPKPGPELLQFTPEQIEAAYAGKVMPEAVAMYLAIERNVALTGKDGWFKPAQSRFSWPRLSERFGVAKGEALTKDRYSGDVTLFNVLDRDRDQQITPADLDWSENSLWLQQSNFVSRLFRRIESNGDGKLTSQEWQAFYSSIAEESDSIGPSQFRDALMPPVGGLGPGDMPSKEVLIKSLMGGELGSLQEGPGIGEMAPDFELRPLVGGEPVRLQDRIGKKPIVLVFGNFTCSPFRSTFPKVEMVYQRQKANADFLLIYVREAHPTDGWAMVANEKVGVSIPQPKTNEDRFAVAEQCSAKLNPSMPLLVDNIDDSVGNAYSGMPTRLYVIDLEGKIAYKSGRGPYGFKPEEMEQALVMLLMEYGALTK